MLLNTFLLSLYSVAEALFEGVVTVALFKVVVTVGSSGKRCLSSSSYLSAKKFGCVVQRDVFFFIKKISA
jgi:hypothetical protein